MNNLDIAQQLAAITGKSVDSFFNGEKNGDEIEHDGVSSETELTGTGHISAKTSTEGAQLFAERIDIKSRESGTDFGSSDFLSEEMKQYDGVVVNGCILDNKVIMSRKEYLQKTKHLTREQVSKHPLRFVMFRSEGQMNISFPSWLDGFKDE